MRILREPPVSLSMRHRKCSVPFGAVVDTALDKEPATRFQSAREFQAALQQALQMVVRRPSRDPMRAKFPSQTSDSDHESDVPTRRMQNPTSHKR